MEQLFKKLTEHLYEYTPEEITAQLMGADIKATSKRIVIVYANGVMEKLSLKDGKLIQRETPKVMRRTRTKK